MIKCDYCGKWFEIGNREDGIPNGFSFVKQDGSTLTICAECLMEIGRNVNDSTQRMERLYGEGNQQN